MTEVQKGLNKQLLDGTLKVQCISLSHFLPCHTFCLVHFLCASQQCMLTS